MLILIFNKFSLKFWSSNFTLIMYLQLHHFIASFERNPWFFFAYFHLYDISNLFPSWKSHSAVQLSRSRDPQGSRPMNDWRSWPKYNVTPVVLWSELLIHKIKRKHFFQRILSVHSFFLCFYKLRCLRNTNIHNE